jgi:hypothetical protein
LKCNQLALNWLHFSLKPMPRRMNL